MGNTLQNKVIQFHEKTVFDFLKKIRNYLVANPIDNDIPIITGKIDSDYIPHSEQKGIQSNSFFKKFLLLKTTLCLKKNILLKKKTVCLIKLPETKTF